jgi:hypothetical protein
MKKRQIFRQIITGWIRRRRLIHSSFNTQLISINYLLYRNNHLSMPWKTINQKRRRKRIAPSYVSKDDSFINEHFIPKKANDDRRVVVSGLKFQKRTKIGL